MQGRLLGSMVGSMVAALACACAAGDPDDSGFGPGFPPGPALATDDSGGSSSSEGGVGPTTGGDLDGGDDPVPPPDMGADDGGPIGTVECPALDAWIAAPPFATGDDTSHPLPSFAVGDWFYVHTITGGDRVLLAASPQDDGSLGPWQTASEDHGGGPHGFTAIHVDGSAFHFRNGHIAEYPLDDAGHMLGDVVLHESNPDEAFGGEKFVWDSAVWVAFDSGAQWVFHLGGFSFTPYDYRPAVRRSGVPLAPTFASVGRDHPAGRPGKAAAFVPPGAETGWIFTGESGGSGLWRAQVTAAGDLGEWQPQPDLPAGTGNERGDLFVSGRALFAVRGSTVHRAFLDSAGDLGPWTSMPSLPEDQIDITWGDGHLEGAAWGIIGDLVLLTGPKTVYAARLVPDACP